jgi:hypothetical protein
LGGRGDKNGKKRRGRRVLVRTKTNGEFKTEGESFNRGRHVHGLQKQILTILALLSSKVGNNPFMNLS